MAFRFDPPLALKNDLNIETLDEAVAFVHTYTTARLPKTKDSVLFWLTRANDSDQQEKAADMFHAWVNLEDVLAK
jgi:hypothetical protein